MAADIGASTGVDGICTIKGLDAREGSGPGGVLENLISLTSCLALADGTGDRSSNERPIGGSVVGRAGAGRAGAGLALLFSVDCGFGICFSGLPGGVLKGETLRSGDARPDRGFNVLVSE